jgi:hypothetical protein
MLFTIYYGSHCDSDLHARNKKRRLAGINLEQAMSKINTSEASNE